MAAASNIYGGGRLLLRFDVVEQPWWPSVRCRSLWLELVLHARWHDHGKQRRGETVVFQNALANNLGTCKRTVSRALAELASHGEISQRQLGPSGRHGTVITVKSYDRFCRPGVADGPALYIDRAGLAGIAEWSNPEARCLLVALAMYCHHGAMPHVVTCGGTDIEVPCGHWFGSLEDLAQHAGVSAPACEKILRKLRKANVIRFRRMPGKSHWRIELQDYSVFGQLPASPVTGAVTHAVTGAVTHAVTGAVTQYEGYKGDKEDRLIVGDYQEGAIDLSDRWRDEPFWRSLPAEWREEWEYAWEERAACLEYEEGMPRRAAEKMAYQRVRAEWQRRGAS